MSEEIKPQLHVSQIRRLCLCGEQYRRIYVLGERRPPGAAAIIGTANDRAHKSDLQHKIDAGELESLSATADIVRDSVNHQFEDGVALQRGESVRSVRGHSVDRAVRINKVRHEEIAAVIRPTAVGTKWVAVLEGYPYDVAGEIDVEDEIIPVRDLKTSGGYPTKTAADDSMQLDMYALHQHCCNERSLPMPVSLDYVTDVMNKSGPKTTARILQSTRTEGHIESMLARIERVIECLEKGIFLPADPDSWVCCEKWCGWFNECPFAKGRSQVGYEGEGA
jgi:hypothetical protein